MSGQHLLDELYALDASTLDQDTAVRFLMAIREFRVRLGEVASDIERRLTEIAPRRFTIPDVGEVEIKKAKKYSEWDNEKLTATVVAYALDERILDEETGEYEAGFSAVARVLSECSRPSWRLTALRARGIDETEYCKVDEGAMTVRLPPRKS